MDITGFLTGYHIKLIAKKYSKALVLITPTSPWLAHLASWAVVKTDKAGPVSKIETTGNLGVMQQLCIVSIGKTCFPFPFSAANSEAPFHAQDLKWVLVPSLKKLKKTNRTSCISSKVSCVKKIVWVKHIHTYSDHTFIIQDCNANESTTNYLSRFWSIILICLYIHIIFHK